MYQDISTTTKRTIAHLSIPESVKDKTLEIYTYLKSGADCRQNNRLKLLCYCIHQAYVELDEYPPSPARLAEILGVETSLAVAALKNRPHFVEAFQPKSVTVNLPKMLERHIVKVMHLKPIYVEDMVATFEVMLEQNQNLLLDQADPLIAAFIYCYAENNAMTIDETNLAESFHLEPSTIRSRYGEIREAYEGINMG